MNSSAANHPKVVLCILDGVGYRTGPDRDRGNAIIAAKSDYYDSLFERYPFTTLEACGLQVGLPEGQMGNSEVGHLTIGAGRIINQELVRISKSLESGEFAALPAWNECLERAQASSGRLHLLGLVSPGGVHSHTDHLYGILEAARDAGITEIFVHAFMDGRDTDPHSGQKCLADLQAKLDELGVGRIASVCGRYWAMDRDKRWDRVKRSWDLMVHGQAQKTAPTAVQAIADSYAANVTDEFAEPTVILNPDGTPVATIADGDSVFYWNFRADRARELTWAFQQEDFDGFDVSDRPNVNYLTMTPYDEKMDLPCVFRPQTPRNGLAEVFAENGVRNLRTAETEKYPHVSFFFNGGREEPFAHEDRRLVPSPKVATYDLQPEMSAPEVAAIVNEACQGTEHDVIIVNFANGDMVGHTGVFEAAVHAFEALDGLLSEIMPPSLEKGTVWLVTADHGNCDEMLTAEGSPMTQHSLNKVPFVVVGNAFEGKTGIFKEGEFGLSDIAPTMLHLLGIEQPSEMTGTCLIKGSLKP